MSLRALFAATALWTGVVCAPAASLAQTPSAPTPPVQGAAGQTGLAEHPAWITRHAGVFGGTKLGYTATVGQTMVSDAAGKPWVRFVTTSYVRDGVADRKARPVLFLFNGGPSVSSYALHIGAFGPKHVVFPADVDAPAPVDLPLADNPNSLIDAADLVFIDPAETGFSRMANGADRSSVYDSDGDAKSVVAFIAAWCKANGREASPKYLLGESYGTVRAAVMAGQMAKTSPLNGVILLGQAVNIVESTQRDQNAISYATNLTALTALAAYHKKIDMHGKSLDALIDEAYAFGLNEYLPALVRYGDLTDGEKRHIAGRLGALTGVSADYYLSHKLVISKMDFRNVLLRDRGLTLGNYDGRYLAPKGEDGFNKIEAGITPALRRYLTQDLGVTAPIADYRSAAPDTRGWRYVPTGGMGGPFADYDYAVGLTAAMAADPSFRLMIGAGVYDLTTTIGPARLMIAESGWTKDRVEMKDYIGGHMAYSRAETLQTMAADIRTFLTARPSQSSAPPR